RLIARLAVERDETRADGALECEPLLDDARAVVRNPPESGEQEQDDEQGESAERGKEPVLEEQAHHGWSPRTMGASRASPVARAAVYSPAAGNAPGRLMRHRHEGSVLDGGWSASAREKRGTGGR